MKAFKILHILLALLLTMSLKAEKSTWKVPADKKDKLSNFAFTAESEKAGEELYISNCKSCHGEPSKGNYQPLVPSPGDPAESKFSSSTDGELYHKIVSGKGLMPSFKNSLSIQETWEIISYIRSFHPKYVQEVKRDVEFAGFKGILQFKLSYLTEENKVQLILLDRVKTTETPVEGAAVKLYAKRYFGILQLDEEKITNQNGIAYFDVTDKIPGDKQGEITVVAKLSDQEAFGDVKSETVLAIGEPSNPVSLTEKRAMWNTMKKVPLWLMATYSIVVLATWGVIFFVLMYLRDIYKIGKIMEEEKA